MTSSIRTLRRIAPFLIALAVCGSARAEEPEPYKILPSEDLSSRWRVNDEDPMASIPPEDQRNSDPLEFGYYLQDMLSRAEGSYRAKDWKNAVKYYKVMAVVVPSVARSYSRMCDSYTHLGEAQLALDSCRAVLPLKGAKVMDHLRLIDLDLRKASFGQSDAAEVIASLEHLREHARLHPQALPGEAPVSAKRAAAPAAKVGWNLPPTPGGTAPEASADDKAQMKKKMLDILENNKDEPEQEVAAGALHLPTQIELSSCRLAVRVNDPKRLEACMQGLRDLKVPESGLMPFKWASALQRHDEAGASSLLAEAAQHKVRPELLASMTAEHEKVFGTSWLGQLKKQWQAIAALGLVLAVTLLMFGRRRASREPLVLSDAK